MDVSADWYDGFFENDWLEQIALGIPDEQTAEQVEFLVEKVGLEKGARVLDLACGHGRIALELARRGYRVTGLDLSPRSLQLAREAAERDGLEIEWVEADMRDIPAGAEFDAVVNVFTALLVELDRAALPLLKPAFAVAADEPEQVDDVDEETATYGERACDTDEHEFDFLRGRNAARWTFLYPDGRRSELLHSVRTYTPHELASMLERAGLAVEEAWGGWDGSELSFESRRLIMLARKPA